MNWGDTVYVIKDDDIREAEYRGRHSPGSVVHRIWMTEEKIGQSKFQIYTFWKHEIFADINDAKKILFKIRLHGYT